MNQHPGAEQTRRRDLLVFAGCVIVVASILGPFIRTGMMLFLDWSSGGRPRLDPTVWGFRGEAATIPINVVTTVLTRFFPKQVYVIFLFFIVLVAMTGIVRMLGHASVASMAGASLYVLNPFVYDRLLAGHVGLLIGYALLPHAIHSARQLGERPAAAGALRLSLWLTAMVASSPHLGLIAGPVILVIAVMGSGSVRRRAAGVFTFAVAALLLASYWLAPSASAASGLQRVTRLDLGLFRTRADPTYGLGLNVAGLYGFWRQEFAQAKEHLGAWPVLLAAMLLIIVIGAIVGVRDPQRRRLSIILIVAGIVGFFLALGDQGPTRALFIFLFDHLPGFHIMREPQKFIMLLVLAYAFFYGLGAHWLLGGIAKKSARAALVVALIALPCVYTYKMFWGFGGQVKPSTFPASWAAADRIMGDGPERALALPWHLYLSFRFTQGRVVANPASSYFRRDVIIGDNIELGPLQTQTANPRSVYLQFLYDHTASTPHFGNLIAPLGIKYVLLMKEADWRAFDSLYQKRDLKLLLDTPDLALFRNLEPVSLAYAPRAEVRVRDWNDVIALSDRVRLTDYAIRLDPAAQPSRSIPKTRPSLVSVVRTSPVRYRFGPVRAPFVVLTEPFDREWHYRGARAQENLGATNVFPVQGGVSPSGSSAFYTRWRIQLIGYIVSGLALVLCISFLIRTRVRGDLGTKIEGTG